MPGPPWLFALATGAWVAGFDVIYACEDVDFDRRHGLRSIPGAVRDRTGVGPVAPVSRRDGCGAGGAGLVGSRWVPSTWSGSAAVAVLLAYEQSLVSAADLSRAKQAFDLNGYVGILYLAATAAAIHVG